jgi:sodium/potassium-transporting ATPase subunit alpha
VFARTTPS